MQVYLSATRLNEALGAPSVRSNCAEHLLARAKGAAGLD